MGAELIIYGLVVHLAQCYNKIDCALFMQFRS